MKTQKINPKEVRGMALEKKEEWKTIADVEALPEGTRAELIDGEIFLQYGSAYSSASRNCRLSHPKNRKLY